MMIIIRVTLDVSEGVSNEADVSGYIRLDMGTRGCRDGDKEVAELGFSFANGAEPGLKLKNAR